MAAVPSWEAVLDAVAEDLARTADLVFGDQSSTAEVERLVAPVTLPALSEMPAVPADLRERIVELQDRIRELQDELARTLAQWRPPRPPVPVAVGAERPLYVDRRV